MVKPYYQTEGITLYHGDCREIMPQLGKVDAIVTDPPYGIGWTTDYDFDNHNSSVQARANRLTRKSHTPIQGDADAFDPTAFLSYPRLCMWGANYYSDKLPVGSWLIWDKRDNGDRAFMSEAEAAWVNRPGAVKLVKHCWQGFSRASENSEHYHPTQKPVYVMGQCLDLVKSEPGHIILDPFMGSGTTGVACIRTGRKFIGIEIEEKYCEIAAKRIQNELAQGRLELA